MVQKTFKVQNLDGGFVVHTNNGGKTNKAVKTTVEEVAETLAAFYAPEPEKPAPKAPEPTP